MLLALSASVFALSILFSIYAVYETYPELAVATSIDLVISAPLFYFLAIRKSRIPNITALTVVGLGVIVTRYLIPENRLGFMNSAILGLIVVGELVFFIFVSVKAYSTVRSLQQLKATGSDMHSIILRVCAETLGDNLLSKMAGFEISVIYHALFPGRRIPAADDAFSYHKKRGTTALFLVLIFVLFAETAVLHLLIEMWSVTIAWFVTIPTLYLVFLLLAQLRSSYRRPILISDGILLVRCGLLCDSSIPLNDIAGVESGDFTGTKDDVYRVAFLKGVEPLNIKISLDREIEIEGLYGLKKKTASIAIFVDDPDRFISFLKQT